MGKSSGGQQEINQYRMSIHFGIGAELDTVTGIFVGEKLAWSGEMATEGAIAVDAPNLFGGEKKEGGVGGLAYFLPGGRNQVLPQGLAARRGLTSTTHPAYRGLASIYMVGSMQPGDGFYWGNTPYQQGVWVRGRRAPKGLAPAYAMIGNRTKASFSGYQVTVGSTTVTLQDGIPTLVEGHTVSFTYQPSQSLNIYMVDGNTITFADDGAGEDGDKPSVTVNGQTVAFNGVGSISVNGIEISSGGGATTISFGSTGQDANPSHIIYECLTNTSWGMGADDNIIDRQNAERVAVTLFNEGFGMSMTWTRESSIESFITEVLDHIQAAIYVDPETGKLTWKLFRDDYDDTTLPLISPDNGDLDNYQRKLWGETVNEVVVTYTNPVNEQEETVTYQDLGNIVIQGGVVSDSRNYYGVRNAPLAQRLAQRDARQSSAPLASVEATLDRTQWNLRPGSVVRLTWPEYDIENLVMRVTSIDYGKVGEMAIRVSLLEDIFSLEDAAYSEPPSTGWQGYDTDPTPMDFVQVITAPAFFSARRLQAAEAAALQYPDVLVAILASSSNPGATLYELVGQTVIPNGDTVAEEIGTRSTLGFAQMPTGLPEQATTVVPTFGTIIGGSQPTVAGFAFIGNVSERLMEIALIESVDESGWKLQRGVLDTVPRAWPAGTPVWFYDVRYDFFDTDLRSEGEAANFKLLTMTSRGRLPLASAPVNGAVLTARPHLPNRPANVQVNGVPFGPVDLSATTPTPASVTVAWANRNRTMEDVTVFRWGDANVVPESGQTTTIRLVKTDGTLLKTYAGLTGTSYAVPTADWGTEYEADLQIAAARDGFESLQYTVRRVRLTTPGGTPPVTDPGTPPDEPYDPGTDFPDPWDRPCLAIGARYLLANDTHDGPAGTCTAEELRPGITWLWTRHAETGEWGSHLVLAVKLVEDEIVLAAPGLPTATPEHPFWLEDGWQRMKEIGQPAGTATVARITVDSAATYTTVEEDGSWVVSHNLKSTQRL